MATSGSWQGAAGNAKAVTEGFNEVIICKGMAWFSDQRVGALSRESYRLSEPELPAGRSCSQPINLLLAGN